MVGPVGHQVQPPAAPQQHGDHGDAEDDPACRVSDEPVRQQRRDRPQGDQERCAARSSWEEVLACRNLCREAVAAAHRFDVGVVAAGSSALRRRRIWTSTVRSSTNTWSPQTWSSSCERENTRSGCVMKKCSRRNSVGPICSDWLLPDRRCVTGSSFRPPTSMTSSVSWGAAAQHGLDAGHQLLGREGLGDVVVGAGFQAVDLVLLGALGGEHDDRTRVRSSLRSLRATAGRRCRAASSPAGSGRAARRGSGSGPGRRRRRAAPVSGEGQVDGDQFLDGGFVFDDENGAGHGGCLGTMRSAGAARTLR